MVTETNDQGTESTVEVTEIPLKIDESVEAPAPAETPAPDPVDDLAKPDDSSIEVPPAPEPQANTETELEPTRAPSEELRKYQSATDKRIAEMETQLENERAARQRAEQLQNSSTLEAEVNEYGRQLTQRFLDQGLDEQTSIQMAQQQTALAKEAYLAKQRADQVVNNSKQMQNELNTRTQLAKAYELSTQYGVSYAELQDLPDPATMEKHAKALATIKKLEGRVQQVTPAQSLNNANPAADVAPTNSEDVLDRYNAGDPAITTEMAKMASKKLGFSIFD
jgi:hypothetical protein|tara:strand:+ start:130 stop:969 length:840 start_codon:yes stop_codon:yes gene_type:complete